MLEYFISSFSQFLAFNDTLYVIVCSTAVIACHVAHKILRGGKL